MVFFNKYYDNLLDFRVNNLVLYTLFTRKPAVSCSSFNVITTMRVICFSDLKKAALFANGYHHYPPHLTHLPFMPMGHPAMMGLAMANHLGIRPDMNMMPDRRGTDLTSPRSVGSFRCELDSFVD